MTEVKKSNIQGVTEIGALISTGQLVKRNNFSIYHFTEK
jgi:hypothetical protein